MFKIVWIAAPSKKKKKTGLLFTNACWFISESTNINIFICYYSYDNL